MTRSRLAVLVPGGRGQVGSELRRIVSGWSGALVHAPGSGELDVTDAEAVADAVDSFAETARDSDLRPVVVNAAAYTAVDAAEEEPDRSAAINVAGAAALADACGRRGVPLLHISTDYVFPGDATRPYEPDDETGPRTSYGRTKLDGERAVLDSGARAWVVRTAWVYGAGGKNFVKTMARLESERDTLSVVDDQVGCPTWAADLAAGLLELAGRVAERKGPEQRVLHCVNGGQSSWFEFARAVFAELGADPERVRPCSSEEFPLPAPRPAYSVLSGRAWEASGLTPLRHWREALAAAFAADGDALRGR
ncbi:dTDP-4-dehydrorhamnose reductase [Saccharopolyspora erythraea NRRL 2338]|uniref:dTDP-4-dehydrorhamnose reductase n=2 Tax=Saccharopolyspora erythraea TaxID=1836 RepID=A4FNM3_SACEN|nr:dTDP-4-dehydrorhamnose reductase [Saccharopolyspora erythraea]AAA68212.1 thymidine diphospho-4-keto-6-deoxyglucose 3, 5-epimerase [Saccharopolyspora erythraea NRRL 2338]EQD84050.1 dTDP-4-dehydrorhamnose reductase [Saccharopolyspora erythraea D]PFG99286.1 dTDP-4-dehydrorhamnose reductase [Saccharopolyspora erythraea NRRL 2338]QRK89222.1 dTDP-4-dehydrorhamnose reductase [Saccharopolyspora erythraea]CAM05648.1 dTDP-4-dehydrorhamnose reductase [Saccharopolyspora erythraea NRRL 2338]